MTRPILGKADDKNVAIDMARLLETRLLVQTAHDVQQLVLIIEREGTAIANDILFPEHASD